MRISRTIGTLALLSLGVLNVGCKKAAPVDEFVSVLNKADTLQAPIQLGVESRTVPIPFASEKPETDGHITRFELEHFIKDGKPTSKEKKMAQLMLDNFDRIAGMHSAFGMPTDDPFVLKLRNFITANDIRSIAIFDGDRQNISEQDIKGIPILITGKLPDGL